jgi:hypothetical protein
MRVKVLRPECLKALVLIQTTSVPRQFSSTLDFICLSLYQNRAGSDSGLNLQVIRMVGESMEAVGAGVGGGSSGQKIPTLEEYGTNLTKLAEEVCLPFPSCFARSYK